MVDITQTKLPPPEYAKDHVGQCGSCTHWRTQHTICDKPWWTFSIQHGICRRFPKWEQTDARLHRCSEHKPKEQPSDDDQ